MKRKLYSFSFILFFGFQFLYCSKEMNEDSIKVYKLGSIIEVSGSEIKTILPTNIKNINFTKISKTDANSFKELALIIPSSHTQVTSRGEALIFMRGVGDRRLGIYLDGVPLNEPWDRRFSLSMIPTEVLGNISAQNGSASILFGANSMAGAMDITTIEKQDEGYALGLKLVGGTANTKSVSITSDGKIGNFNFIANFSYFDTDGQILSGQTYRNANSITDLSMINQLDNTHIRTNTDIKRINGFLRGELDFQNIKIGISYIKIDGEFGIAPLGYDTEKPRFWRYPEYNRNLFSLHYTQYFNEEKSHNLKSVLWYDIFNQSIDEYSDIKYLSQISNTNDEMTSFGTRTSYSFKPSNNQWFTAMISAYKAENTETINIVSSKTTEFDYSEILFDIGAEYRIRILDNLILSSGILASNHSVPKAGEFILQYNKSNIDFGGIIGAKLNINDNNSLFANITKKMSFPALREAYANTPNKFEPNPNLGPEQGILSEIGYELTNKIFLFNSTIFYNIYDDMIEQTKIKINGINKNQRVNFAKAYFVGLENTFSFNYLYNIDFFGHFTYIYSKKKLNNSSEWGELPYVPNFYASATLSYNLQKIIKIQIEGDYLGNQYDESIIPIKINPSFIVNLRFSHKFQILKLNGDYFVRFNNLFDKERYSTLGLPDAGLTITTGLIITI